MNTMVGRPAGPQVDDEVPIGQRLHPVQTLEKNHFAETQRMRYTQMQDMFGMAMPLRQQFMERSLMSNQRLAPLESSYIALDCYRGDHEDITWEDYLADPMNDDRMRKDTRDLMEEQRFGRILRPTTSDEVM